MIKYKDIYAIEGVTLTLTDWVISDAWFPEIDASSRFSEVLDQLQEDKRLIIKRIIDKNFDGERYASMHTLWFDGQPMAIVQDAGRGGRDLQQRWVTDVKVYGQALAYLLLLSLDVGDLVDPEELVYEEHLCHFYGTDFSKALGFENETARTDVEVIRLSHGILDGEPYGAILASLKVGAPDLSEYIRRGGDVFKKDRLVTKEESMEKNPRIFEVNECSGRDRAYVYHPSARPLNVKVESV